MEQETLGSIPSSPELKINLARMVITQNSADSKKDLVLACVIKDKRDLDILLSEKWYRIPAAHMPKRSFKYLVFYQPALFGRRGKRILYYARVLSHQIIKRSVLLPDEPNHPGTDNYYFRFRV